MEICVQLTGSAIPDAVCAGDARGETGAWVAFRGVVRSMEEGRRIRALRYEAYVPMAQAQMEKIQRELEKDCPCLAARVLHRHGIVPVGETAILVEIRAGHRGEAFAMLSRFMDRLKQDVPIWKVEAISE